VKILEPAVCICNSKKLFTTYLQFATYWCVDCMYRKFL